MWQCLYHHSVLGVLLVVQSGEAIYNLTKPPCYLQDVEAFAGALRTKSYMAPNQKISSCGRSKHWIHHPYSKSVQNRAILREEEDSSHSNFDSQLCNRNRAQKTSNKHHVTRIVLETGSVEASSPFGPQSNVNCDLYYHGVVHQPLIQHPLSCYTPEKSCASTSYRPHHLCNLRVTPDIRP